MCKFITNGLEKDREVGAGAAGWIGHWSLLLGEDTRRHSDGRPTF
ncbi:hypothetical protein [Paenibacillus sp.]